VAAGRRERKVVTVLFADLVGSTSRAEQLDPEDVAEELGRYHERVRADLERHGGTVEKFIGDAVMALFGAPTTREDDAERAVRAALAIRGWALDEGVEVRIGVNTGEALVRVDARPEAGESMAAGDVINTGARLQSAAAVNTIVVGEQTLRATEQAIEYRELDPVDAKGKARPVPAWEALQARSRIAVERVHGATLVGRQREVALLEDALARVRAERSSQLVTIVGVPGIGKSRLVLELYEAVERMPELIAWRHGRCLSYGEGVTFWALAEMVKAQLGLHEGDDASVAEQKLSASVSDPWVESHLRPLLGLAGGTTAKGDRRDEAFAAWRRYFEELAEERPLVLVFEDLHWADDHLLDFVDYLVEWAAGVPLLVVCTARPELLTRRPGWGGGKPNALAISLSALSDEEVARLLAELLGAVLPAETQAELLARAGGNPLYAEEFARMLRDRGEVGRLPETVQGLIAARLDLLVPEQKALLQDAAVVGARFWAGALASHDASPSLEQGLHELERKEFVRRERDSTVEGDRQYAFRHLLVRDVAYSQIPRAERAEKHLLAAGWIEQLGRREDHAEMLAHHYLQALELTAAAGGSNEAFAAPARSALADAGDRAFALNAYDAAAGFFRAALDLLSDDDSGRGRLLYALGRSLYQLGTPDPEMLDRAVEELLAVGDVEGAAEAETTLCEQTWLEGETATAMEHLERARRLLADRDPSPAKARMTATAARLMMLSSRDEEAIRLGKEALALAEELGRDEIKASALVDIGSAQSSLGSDEGIRTLTRAIDVAREANAAFDLARAMGNLGAFRWQGGKLEGVGRLRLEALQAAQEYGQAGFARWFRGVLIVEEYERGDWDGGYARADAFLAEVEAGSPHYLAAQCYLHRALIALGRDELEGIGGDVERGLALAERVKDPQTLYMALAIGAHVRAQQGDLAGAVPLAEEFLRAVEGGQGLGFGIAYLHVLVWTLTACGRGAEAAAALEDYAGNAWARAGIAFGRGDPAAAADIFAAMGAHASEAFCRLSAARELVEQDRRAEADGHLRSALGFHRAVGAARYVREGESLLAATG
jgi:class 3 adenylate cyclase/tetratricopeptide (TPR) repeat protein